MIRAVLDTNVLVSYLLVHRPPIATLIDVHLARDVRPVTAPVLLQELERVLRYPRLQQHVSAAERRRFVALIAALSELVELPPAVPRICRDPGDDWVLACAVAGRADAIVSGDRDLLALGQVGRIAIVNAEQFLALVEKDSINPR